MGGPEICRTEYESECWTKQEEHDVQDDVVECETVQDEKCDDETSGYTTFTKCLKEPRELCAPAGCGFKEGAEVCYDKTQTIVQDAPDEECVDVPKEVCTRSKTNPRKVKKPVVKKWCY